VEASATRERVRSNDGTPLAPWRSGAGPPLVLVHGTTGAHWSFASLTPILAAAFGSFAVELEDGRAEQACRGDFERAGVVRMPGDVHLASPDFVGSRRREIESAD
jgi:hypothetical protein